ncbi:MAG: spore coat protein CotJB [Clostridia bacterium]|nr:spore coat protein CotJB [Clostridia bacterium]
MMRSMNCNRNASANGRCDCKKQMQMLRALDFAIQETVLYLDAYPDNRQALEYYHRLIEERRAAMTEYENGCGPVTMYGNTDRQHWHWIDSPWPWEADAN